MLISVDFLLDFVGPNRILQKLFLGNMALLIKSYHGKMNTMASRAKIGSQMFLNVLSELITKLF